MIDFNRLKRCAVLVGVPFFLAMTVVGCAKPKPGSPEAVYIEQQKQEEARSEAVEVTIDQLPDWFMTLPTDANSVYSAGTATSPDLQLAFDKATLNAKRVLADRINSLVSSKMKEFVAEIGQGEDTEVVTESERVTTNLITEVNINGYTQSDAQVIQQGSNYRAYILLQYPIGKANRILIDQIKQNRILEARLRASEAFKELEEEIERARE
jgi:hypothetical protein